MDNLPSLIERLEKAEGPAYELDVAIFEALGAFRSKAPDPIIGDQTFWIYHGQARSAPPKFTASLDSAVGLVPEGAYCKIQLGRDRKHNWVWVEMDDREAVACAPAPAIALCIACLRAREVIRELGKYQDTT